MSCLLGINYVKYMDVCLIDDTVIMGIVPISFLTLIVHFLLLSFTFAKEIHFVLLVFELYYSDFTHIQ